MFEKQAFFGSHLAIALVLLLALSFALSGAKGLAEEQASSAGVQGSTSAPLHPRTSAQSRTITYSYDAAGRLVQADYGGGRSVTYGYDASGNLLRRQVGVGYPAYLPVIMR